MKNKQIISFIVVIALILGKSFSVKAYQNESNKIENLNLRAIAGWNYINNSWIYI